MRVEPFQGPAEEWTRFLSTASGATHCHRAGWLDVIRDTFGHETFAWAARGDDGRLAGVLPLVRVRTPLFGHYLVSMPFLNAGGPVGTADGVRALAEEAGRLAERERPRLLELRSRVEQSLGMRLSQRKITVELELPADVDALWSSFPSKLRSQIRRPEKEGALTRFGPGLVGDFYRVFARHMRDLGTPVMPFRFFERAVAAFGADAWVGCAYLGDVPVAAGLGFRFGASFELTWASALRSHQRLAVNMLLYWSFLRRAVEEGCTRFDFGRCSPGGTTHRFKRQWGGEDRQLWWYQQGRSGATPAPDQGGVLSLAPRLWRHLPVRLASAIGPHIVRGIP